ncbi:MAG TPA: enoyl-CoA hydratase/isomerase family protein [Jatrophihabitans sp.]|jgi:2-(1,2-epoxy-1,2-dihydrophenyl)acetyl-CoA isomerase
MTQTVSTTNLRIETVDGVRWIAIARPDAGNAIDTDTRIALSEALTAADTDPAVRCIVISGDEKAFCTGADLRGPDIATPENALDFRRALVPFQQLFQQLWEIETPVISAVQGTVAGIGWMLALLADLVVASDTARWIHVFGRRGMAPHAGDPFFLPRILPFHVLNEIALLGDAVSSTQLERWGAVNRLVPAAEVEPTAWELAKRLAVGPTRSFGQAKRLYRRSLVSDMATAFAEEQAATAMLSTTNDRVEGMASFVEGRRPSFSGT